MREVLAGLRRQSVLPDEIIVVHSGPDEIVGLQPDDLKHTNLIRIRERLFAGAARNRGAEAAAGKWLMFIDNDCVPSSTWLEQLMSYANTEQTPLVLGAVGYAEKGGYWGMVRWLLEFSAIAPYGKSRRVTRHGASCNMAVTAQHFSERGGFHPEFQMGQDKKFFRESIRQLGPVAFTVRGVVKHANIPGFSYNMRHCVKLGWWSARVEIALLAGKHSHGLLRCKFALMALPAGVWRWLAIGARVLRWPMRERMRHLLLWPGAAVALLFWVWGFWRGSCAKDHDEGGPKNLL